MDVDSGVDVARRVAATLAGRGARAVCLVGSVARGDAHPASDIDLIALGSNGAGPAHVLQRHHHRLVSISWRTPEQVREAFTSPPDVGGAVPAWRGALVLHDPDGTAAALKREAEEWRWAGVDAACDRWVAAEVTGFAEEVHRIHAHRDRGWTRPAAVLRALLAIRMAMIMAVHLRILYDSENRLWDLVADRLGPEWAAAQDRALGVPTNDPDAALDLYRRVAAQTAHLLDPTQAAVVDGALDLEAS